MPSKLTPAEPADDPRVSAARFCLAAVATALLVLLVGCGNPPPPAEEADLSPPLEVTSDQPPPVFEFPAETRTDDPTLNEFIGQVFAVCRVGRYEDYRLLHSAYLQPLSRDSFRQYWEKVASITVESVVPLAHAEESADPDRPAWKVTAHITFGPDSDPPERTIRFVISREGQRWVLGQAPSDTTDEAAVTPVETPG